MPPRPRSMVPRGVSAAHVALVRPAVALPKPSTATSVKRPAMTLTKGPPYTASVLSPAEEAQMRAPFLQQQAAAAAAATAAAATAAAMQPSPESAGGGGGEGESSSGVDSSPDSYPDSYPEPASVPSPPSSAAAPLSASPPASAPSTLSAYSAAGLAPANAPLLVRFRALSPTAKLMGLLAIGLAGWAFYTWVIAPVSKKNPRKKRKKKAV